VKLIDWAVLLTALGLLIGAALIPVKSIEAPEEARLYYMQGEQRCRAQVIILGDIDKLAKARGLPNLEAFTIDMDTYANLHEELRPIVLALAQLYYESADSSWIVMPPDDSGARVSIAELQQWTYNHCRDVLHYRLNEYMKEWAAGQQPGALDETWL